MATATIEKSKELGEGTTSGLVFESLGETVMARSLPFGPDEPVYAGHMADGLPAATAANVPMPLVRDGFLTSLMGRLAAFNSWLAGPPLSEGDRVTARLVRARDERFARLV